MNPNADHDPYSPSLYDLMHAYPRKRKSRGGGIWVCLSFGLGGAIMAGILAAFVFFVLADGKLTIDDQAGTETAQAQTAAAQTLAAIPTVTPTLTRAPSLTPGPTMTATKATLLPADTPTITPTSFSALVPLAT